MKISSLTTLALVAALSQTVLAQTKAPETMALAASAPGSAVVAQKTRLTATVVAIDAASRTVTLKGAKGRVTDVVMPIEAKNFDKVKVGDLVDVEYAQALSLQLVKKSGNDIRAGSVQAASAPAPAGAVAGGAVARQVVILADVMAVNPKAGTVTLRGPKGNVVDLAVPDPGQLKRVKVGDQVEAVYTEAVAITVEPAARPAKK